MATAVLFSQHSSNPLEVSSSDALNLKLHQQYQKAQRAVRGDDSMCSSDDPLAVRGEIEAYQTQRTPRGRGVIVDLDESMESDDELMKDDDDDDDASGLDVTPILEKDEGEEAGRDEAQDVEEEQDEEQFTILLKSQEEREEIEQEIADLQSAVPVLTNDYRVIDRLGTGTFSSVYKAVDLGYHTKWENTPWHGYHPSSSSANYQSVRKPPGTKAFVAVKRIYVTSNPERIRNEIAILEDCRGSRHVSQLITAFRHEDQVVIIMPYHRNDDFRDYYRILPIPCIKAYFRCMFRALRDIHARGIIHRDVKPANFLFDPTTGIGTLCDFGLASRLESSSVHMCLHGHATREFPHGKLRNQSEHDIEQIKKKQREARQKSNWPSEKVGYPDKDTRPHSKANRAGTRGFRAPEVLMKCSEQTGAIDVWSAGMIFLFFLTGKFPLLQSSDDIEALMEIATIIGRRKMERVATLHSRTFATNVPTVSQDGMPWREFVQKQNESLLTPRKPDARFYPYNTHRSHINTHLPPPSSSSGVNHSSPIRSPSPSSLDIQPPSTEEHSRDIDQAFDLLEGLMHPESTRRMTPRDALYHPFLVEPSEPEDDEFFPHPLGQGVCGDQHFIDEVTEDHRVRIVFEDSTTEVRRISFGEGIAIGKWPCEFHRKDYLCEE